MNKQNKSQGIFPVTNIQTVVNKGTSQRAVDTLADAILKAVNSNFNKLEKKLEKTTKGIIVQTDDSTGDTTVIIDAQLLAGIEASQYALKTDTVANSLSLGGIAASDYALKSQTINNAAYATNAGNATYATNAGNATYATNAENAVKFSGKTYAQVLLAIYPVGAVYISVNSTSPASLFGGSWEQLGNRFLLAAGSSYTAGSTGGAATVTITNQNLPSRTVLALANQTGGSISTSVAGWAKATVSNGSYNASTLYDMYTDGMISYSGGASMNNMPPYLVVYMWKRVS